MKTQHDGKWSPWPEQQAGTQNTNGSQWLQATGRDTYILIGLYILKQGPFAAGL